MPNIQNVRAITTPQKSYQWEVSITGLSTGNDDDLIFHAKTVSIPASQVDQIAIHYKAAQTYYAGRDSSGHTVNITFWDDENQTVRAYFQNWFDNLMFNGVTGAQSPKNLYTANIIIRLMSTDGSTSTAQINLNSAFVTEIGDVSLTYDSSEPVEVNVTFVYDSKVTVS